MRFALPWRSVQPPSTRGRFAAAGPAGRRALAAAVGLGLVLGAVAEGVRGQGNPLPLGEHRDLVVGACVICHSLETMAQQRLDRETWETIVDRMITYGAPITPQTRPRILEYLAKHLGP